MRTPSTKASLNEQAREILEKAQQHGVEQNFFFQTTFRRYQVLLNILADLEEVIRKADQMVTKEYVKGRGNVYTHPAITEYSRVTTTADRTVATLMKIIQTMRKDSENAASQDFLDKWVFRTKPIEVDDYDSGGDPGLDVLKDSFRPR